MKYFFGFLGCIGFILAAVLILCFVCFRLVFFSKRKECDPESIPLPDGKEYEPYYDKMKAAVLRQRALPYREYTMTSRDGLVLVARYYEKYENAPVELMLHGYRGSAERDMSAGISRAFAAGHNAFVVDHRASGRSEGSVITFGVLESQDALDWIELMRRELGEDKKIIIAGISMGAATAVLCAGCELPDCVVGIIADCGYTSARDIIKKVIRDMKLPAGILYPFVRLGGKIFGGFDVDKADVKSAAAASKTPIIFFHSETDAFVPCEMSRENYEACASRCRLVIIPDAPHGLCYLMQPELYINALDEFYPEYSGKS